MPEHRDTLQQRTCTLQPKHLRAQEKRTVAASVLNASLACPACGYDVYQTIADGFSRCPECGTRVSLGICTDRHLLRQDRRSAAFVLALMAWPVLGTFGAALAVFYLSTAWWIAWPALVALPTWIALACVLYRHSSYEQTIKRPVLQHATPTEVAYSTKTFWRLLRRWRSIAWRAAGSAGFAAVLLSVWFVTAGALGLLLAWLVVVMVG